MLRGYRFLIAATCGLALPVALGTGAFFGSLYGPDRKHYQAVAGEQRGQNDYAGPSQSMPDIAGLPGPVERAIANPRPPGGQDHEKRDLAAQEASALWAFWMVAATFASVLITTIGTILLYKQIVLTRQAVEDTSEATDAMREANEIARESMKRQLRAYLSVEKFGVTVFAYEGGFRVETSFEYWNRGQTPCEFIGRKIQICPPKGPQGATLTGDHSAREIGPGAYLPVTWKPEFNFPIETYGEQALFRLNIEYKCRDSFGEVHHRRIDYMFWFPVADAKRIKGARPHVDCKGSYIPETDWFEDNKREMAKIHP